jgi:uncharacterized protein YndB with AHSA1/START domain
MEKEIKKNWQLSQSPLEVWEYLTKPELIEQWLMKTDFQPIVGHKFRFVGGCDHGGSDKEAAVCEVLELKPHTRISYSWQAMSALDSKPFDSTVTWTLTPNGNGTALQLLHTGFRAVEDVATHNDGWTRIGNKLVEFFSEVAK